MLDFIDARTNNLVWRGSMADPVDDPGRLGSEFSKAAKEMLDKFPVAERDSSLPHPAAKHHPCPDYAEPYPPAGAGTKYRAY